MLKEEKRFSEGTVFEGIVSLRTLIENRMKFHDGKSDNNRRILRVYYDSDKMVKDGKEFSWLSHRADELGFEIELTTREIINEMTVGASHGGIAVSCSERNIPILTAEKIKPNGFYVMLDGIEDPYNFGYALRSLYAAGADGVILGKRNWMSAAGVVCRASAGASEMFDLYISDDGACDIMHSIGYKLVCADLRDSVPIYGADLKKPVMLIVGGEKRGISSGILKKADIRVRIDYGREFSASLSAASAATVAGYEIFRQNLK